MLFNWNLTFTKPMLMGNNIILVNIAVRGICAIFKTNHTQSWLITILKSTYLKQKSFLGDAVIVILTISHYFASMFMKITEIQTIVGLYFEEIRQNRNEKLLRGVQFYESYFFFYLGFLSRTFTNHRTAEGGGGHFTTTSTCSQTLKY